MLLRQRFALLGRDLRRMRATLTTHQFRPYARDARKDPDLAQVLRVALVAEQAQDDALVCVRLQLDQPPVHDVLKRRPLRDVVHNERCEVCARPLARLATRWEAASCRTLDAPPLWRIEQRAKNDARVRDDM